MWFHRRPKKFSADLNIKNPVPGSRADGTVDCYFLCFFLFPGLIKVFL